MAQFPVNKAVLVVRIRYPGADCLICCAWVAGGDWDSLDRWKWRTTSWWTSLR